MKNNKYTLSFYCKQCFVVNYYQSLGYRYWSNALCTHETTSMNTLTTKRKQNHKFKMKNGFMERVESDSLENMAINKSQMILS